MSRNMLFSQLNRGILTIRRHLNMRTVGFLLSIIVLSFSYQTYRTQAHADKNPGPVLYGGHENHTVSLRYAASLTRNFRHAPGNDQGTILGEYFGKDALMQALSQETCTGLRIYYGRKEDATPALVLVGVDGSGNDIISGVLLEIGLPCPPYCDTVRALTADEMLSSAPGGQDAGSDMSVR